LWGKGVSLRKKIGGQFFTIEKGNKGVFYQKGKEFHVKKKTRGILAAGKEVELVFK